MFRTHLSREELLANHKMGLLGEAQSLKVLQMQHNSNFLVTSSNGTKQAPSRINTPLNNLRPIVIRQLQPNKTHTGTFLKGKLVAEPLKYVSVMVLVEDSENNLVKVAIYNHPFSNDYKKKFANGKRVIIREPYYKMYADGTPGIRIDHPQDIEFEEEITAVVLNDAEALKQKGNQYFAEKRYSSAIDAYTKAIQIKKEVSFLNNRSMCYCNIREFEKGLTDSEEVLQMDSTNAIAKYRKAKCLVGLQQYTNAKELLQNVLQSEDVPAKIVLDIQSYLNSVDKYEMNFKGDFDFYSMMLQTESSPSQRFDVVDYISPKLLIKETEDMGKGVFTTENITKGELLVVSKAIQVCFPNEAPKLLQVNASKLRMNREGHVQVVSELCKRGVEESGLLKQLYTLYDGKKLQSNDLVVDADRIDKIVDLNSFQLSIHADKEDTKEDSSCSCALFHFPSFFNHSEEFNCFYFFLGDVMIIRALKDVQKDEQLFISYVPDVDAPQKRFKSLKTFWNIELEPSHLILFDENQLEKELEEWNTIHNQYMQQYTSGKLLANQNIPVKKLIHFVEYWESLLGEDGRSMLSIYLIGAKLLYMASEFESACKYFDKFVNSALQLSPMLYKHCLNYILCAFNCKNKLQLQIIVAKCKELIGLPWGNDEKIIQHILAPLKNVVNL